MTQAVSSVFSASKLPPEVEAIETAKNEATVPTADYLLGSPHLSDHLENGMDELGISLVDAEDELVRRG